MGLRERKIIKKELSRKGCVEERSGFVRHFDARKNSGYIRVGKKKRNRTDYSVEGTEIWTFDGCLQRGDKVVFVPHNGKATRVRREGDRTRTPTFYGKCASYDHAHGVGLIRMNSTQKEVAVYEADISSVFEPQAGDRLLASGVDVEFQLQFPADAPPQAVNVIPLCSADKILEIANAPEPEDRVLMQPTKVAHPEVLSMNSLGGVVFHREPQWKPRPWSQGGLRPRKKSKGRNIFAYGQAIQVDFGLLKALQVEENVFFMVRRQRRIRRLAHKNIARNVLMRTRMRTHTINNFGPRRCRAVGLCH